MLPFHVSGRLQASSSLVRGGLRRRPAVRWLREARRSRSVDSEPRRLERSSNTHRQCWNRLEAMVRFSSTTTYWTVTRKSGFRSAPARHCVCAAQRSGCVLAGAMFFDAAREGSSWSRVWHGSADVAAVCARVGLAKALRIIFNFRPRGLTYPDYLALMVLRRSRPTRRKLHSFTSAEVVAFDAMIESTAKITAVFAPLEGPVLHAVHQHPPAARETSANVIFRRIVSLHCRFR